MARPLAFLRRLLSKTVPTGGTAEQVVKSGVWVVSLNVSDRALQIVLLIVLSNLLTPADFGVYGVAVLAVGTLKRVSNLGLSEALIHEADENVDAYLDTAVGLRLARGVAIAVVLFLAAPWIAQLVDEPRAVPIVRVAGLSPLLVGLHNPAAVYFRKRLDFHREFVYRVSGSLLRFGVGIGWAFAFQNVWALVAGFLAADCGRLLGSYVASDYRPRPTLDRQRAREMITYGKWITGSSVVYFLYSQGDDAVVATLASSAALGYYQLSYRLSNAPGTETSEMIRSVMFPAFSQLQDDPETLRDGFFTTLRVTTTMAFPMAVGIAVVAPSFVRAFMGSEWTPMIPVMQVLTGYGILLAIISTYRPVWKAIGRPDYSTKLGVVRVCVLAVFILPVTSRFGIFGTATLVVGAFVFPMFPLNSYLLVESLDTSYRRLARELVYPAVASGTMGVIVAFVDGSLSASPLVTFCVLVAVGGVSYAILVVLLEWSFGWGLEGPFRTVTDAISG